VLLKAGPMARGLLPAARCARSWKSREFKRADEVHRTSNPHNVIKATFDALLRLKMCQGRGTSLEKQWRSSVADRAGMNMAASKNKSGKAKISG